MEIENIGKLEKALRASWDKKTCYPNCAKDWSPANPELGQCAVTALIVQDYLGGSLLYCEHNFHFWNGVDGTTIDLTRNQFPSNSIICIDGEKSREYVLESQDAIDAKTPERYELLKKRVQKKLRQ